MSVTMVVSLNCNILTRRINRITVPANRRNRMLMLAITRLTGGAAKNFSRCFVSRTLMGVCR